MNLREITVHPVAACDEARFQALLDAHHSLGSLPKIGHTLWYVALWRDSVAGPAELLCCGLEVRGP